MNICQRRSSD